MWIFKKLLLMIIVICCFNVAISLADSKVHWNGSPRSILESVHKWSDVQKTSLDKAVKGNVWIFETLNNIRQDIWPYIEWTVYFGLAVIFVLIVYNWSYLTLWLIKDDSVNKVKTRMMYLTIWAFVLTSFPWIVKTTLDFVQEIFS